MRWTILNLNEFLGGDGGGAYRPPGSSATTTVEVGRGAGSTWADEMDDEGFEDRPKQQIVLPTAPRAALGPDIDDERIPRRPPYTAYIANLPYDVDEDQIMEVFERAKLRIEQVRLMKDDGGRLRGYGYADFQDRESLVDVLTMTDLAVNNRKMRIDLASQAGKDRSGGFEDRGDRRGGRDEDPNAGRSDASSDWRRGPPPETRNDGRYNGRDSYDRDRYNGRDSYDRDGGGRYGGFSRDRDGGRGGYGDRDGYSRDREAPKERPRLALAPRSKPMEDSEGGSSQSSIFGGAKPVDTVKKEKEIEDKLSKMSVSKDDKEKGSVDNAWRRKEDSGGAYRPPGRREEGDRRDRGSSGYDKDRGFDRERRDDHRDRRDDRGYDRRDDRGYDRDRRDDRGYDRDRDRRDDRGYDKDRRDDRD